MTTSDPDEVARVVDEARRICAVPAPTFSEGPRGEFVAGLLSEAGATPQRDEIGNVSAEFGDGAGDDAVVFAAHLDTVFDAGTQIAFTQEDGRLSAPGIGDNSLGVAAVVHMARHLRGRAVKRRIVLAATVGEEGLGDLRGVKALLAARPCGAFVAVEGDMLDSITVAAIGSVRLRVAVTGPGGHPWGDRGTPSAVHALLGPLTEIVGRLQDAGLAVNVGVLGGGTAINVIAREAHASIDLRSEDEDALRRGEEVAREAFADLDPRLRFTLERLGHRPAGAIAPDHPLLLAARRARERAGLGPAQEDGASTDANVAHGQGIPAITVGVTTGANAHRPDEYIDLAPLSAGLASLDALVDELADG